MKTIDRIVWGSVAAIVVVLAILAVALFVRSEKLKRDALARLAAERARRAAVEPWRERRCWRGTRIHGGAPLVVSDAFEADPPAPDGRKKMFATFLGENPQFYCQGWYCEIQSIVDTSDGWEVRVAVGIILSHTAFTRARALEIWKVSKSGEARCLKSEGDPVAANAIIFD